MAATMIPIMAKLSVILRSEGDDLGISSPIGERVQGNNDSPLKNIFYSAITLLIFQFSQNCSIFTTKNNDVKVTLMERLLINRDYTPSNRNKQSLSLKLF